MSRSARIVTAALCIVSVVACGDSGEPTSTASFPSAAAPVSGPPATVTAAADGVVEVLGTSGLRFVPAELTAKVGGRFAGRLVQRGATPHNIDIPALGVKGDDTTTLETGNAKDFSFTPTKAGEFTFVCTFHAQMTGTLTVT